MLKEKEKMFRYIDAVAPQMAAMSDDIFDHPELGLNEYHAFALLTDWLEQEGFAVERGVAGVETAFPGNLSSWERRPKHRPALRI